MKIDKEAGNFRADALDSIAMILAGHRVPEARLSSAFVASQLNELHDRLTAQHGNFVAIGGDGILTARFARAEMPIEFGVDPAGRLAGFSLGPATRLETTLSAEIERIVALPGQVGLFIDVNGTPIARHRSDVPMPVGSAFKIAVLAALSRAVSAGRLAWEQPLYTGDDRRSLPTGILQDWPDGVALSVMALACLMISRSDNTATDLLIAAAGRYAIEAVSPRNRPFLTTREAFILKAAAHRELRADWLGANEDARRRLLATLAGKALAQPRDLSPDLAPAIEWFFTAEELAELLAETALLPPFLINPGPVPRSGWANIAFKGGGEATLVNASFHLTDTDGNVCRLVATHVADDLCDPELVLDPVRAIVRLLRESVETSA